MKWKQFHVIITGTYRDGKVFNMNDRLERFREAQERDYETAFMEIRSGKKTSHWMWYMFPQIAGLGRSEIAKYYEIQIPLS